MLFRSILEGGHEDIVAILDQEHCSSFRERCRPRYGFCENHDPIGAAVFAKYGLRADFRVSLSGRGSIGSASCLAGRRYEVPLDNRWLGALGTRNSEGCSARELDMGDSGTWPPHTRCDLWLEIGVQPEGRLRPSAFPPRPKDAGPPDPGPWQAGAFPWRDGAVEQIGIALLANGTHYSV